MKLAQKCEFDNLLQQSLSQEDGNLTATVGFRKSLQLAGLLACIIQCAWTSILSSSFGYIWPVGSKRNEKHQWKWHKLTDEQCRSGLPFSSQSEPESFQLLDSLCLSVVLMLAPGSCLEILVPSTAANQLSATHHGTNYLTRCSGWWIRTQTCLCEFSSESLTFLSTITASQEKGDSQTNWRDCVGDTMKPSVELIKAKAMHIFVQLEKGKIRKLF